MNLDIALAAASIVLRFSTPGAGSYYVFTVQGNTAHIVAAGHETNACHVCFTLPTGQAAELYRTAFFADQ